jgi:hypothetical protein
MEAGGQKYDIVNIIDGFASLDAHHELSALSLEF